jgi:hypothetical protein
MMFLSYALVLLHPFTCVGLGTGTLPLTLETFLGPFSHPLPHLREVAIIPDVNVWRIFLPDHQERPVS